MVNRQWETFIFVRNLPITIRILIPFIVSITIINFDYKNIELHLPALPTMPATNRCRNVFFNSRSNKLPAWFSSVSTSRCFALQRETKREHILNIWIYILEIKNLRNVQKYWFLNLKIKSFFYCLLEVQIQNLTYFSNCTKLNDDAVSWKGVNCLVYSLLKWEKWRVRWSSCRVSGRRWRLRITRIAELCRCICRHRPLWKLSLQKLRWKFQKG